VSGWTADAMRDPRSMRLRTGRGGRRRCAQAGGCAAKCTHLGLANGIVLMDGCEWHVRMWVKDPRSLIRASIAAGHWMCACGHPRMRHGRSRHRGYVCRGDGEGIRIRCSCNKFRKVGAK